MELTVIIVNYNVKFFLEQCLHSVKKASEENKVEVIVVDNNSVDGSCSMVREKFPFVLLIENKKNLGFSSANNQGLRIAKGKYCLLLNPDTLVEESTFRKCIHFMDDHPEAGALGVKMIDGKGNFLPESKRALPTPEVAFYKIFGLSRLFPGSKIFGKYHLSYLDKEKIHAVDILSGAFMFIRKDALTKAGLLDENFFMYGEDIDISYRIIKAGYRNYYFSETSIIHYKGESTKKGSINYVIVFYLAMAIFAKKHFSKKNARLFTLLIHIAIYFRATLSILKRFALKTFQPGIDAALIYIGFLLFTQFWEALRFGTREYFPPFYYYYVVPAYISIWIISIYYAGGYEKPIRLWNVIRGLLTGTVIILVIYALLPENLRFSRILILLGALWSIPVLLLHRIIPSLFKLKNYELALGRKRKIVIAGDKKEFQRVSVILSETDPDIEIAGFISSQEINDEAYIGKSEQIRDVVLMNRVDEVIFCALNIPSNEIIKYMTQLSDLPVDFKIAPMDSSAIIGSNSVTSAGDLYLVAFSSIGTGVNRRNKRLFDLISALVVILGFPVFVVFIPSFPKIWLNAVKVLVAKKTWIGYCPYSNINVYPGLKSSVFTLCDAMNTPIGEDYSKRLNSEYARNYKIQKDFIILWRNLIRKRKKEKNNSPL